MSRQRNIMRKSLPLLALFIIVSLLYILEYSRTWQGGSEGLNLDGMEPGADDAGWEAFYRVRARLVDGQRAVFSFPREIVEVEGKFLELEGAGKFYAAGCTRSGDSIRVDEFYLYPSVGLVDACELLPDVEMRWTIRVLLKKPWTLHYEDMIANRCRVGGRLRIDTAEPYTGVFFLDEAEVKLLNTQYIR